MQGYRLRNSDLMVASSKSTSSLNNSRNSNSRCSFAGLQTLKEEINTDNIKDVINSLKNLPPINNASRESALAEAEAKLMGTFPREKRSSQLPVLNESDSTKRSVMNSKALSLVLGKNRNSRQSEDWKGRKKL